MKVKPSKTISIKVFSCPMISFWSSSWMNWRRTVIEDFWSTVRANATRNCPRESSSLFQAIHARWIKPSCYIDRWKLITSSLWMFLRMKSSIVWKIDGFISPVDVSTTSCGVLRKSRYIVLHLSIEDDSVFSPRAKTTRLANRYFNVKMTNPPWSDIDWIPTRRTRTRSWTSTGTRVLSQNGLSQCSL